MIRIAVVDDDPAARRALIEAIDQYQRESRERFDVVEFVDGEDLVAHAGSAFDVVFLDVQMSRLDGLDTARRIRARDTDVVIVFVTSSTQYAVKGYEVDALSYLVKPVPYYAFAQELGRSLARIRKRPSRSVMFTAGSELVRVDAADIVYVESDRHRISVHTHDRVIGFSGTLKQMETLLAPHDFFRSNNCYLVNLQHVTGVRATSCVLVGERELQVSRPRRRAFLDALAEYLEGRAA